MGLLPLAVAYLVWRNNPAMYLSPAVPASLVVGGYVYFCVGWCVFSAIHRLWLTLHPERRDALQLNHTTRVELKPDDRTQLAAPGIPRLLARIPGNQVLDLRVHEKRLCLPRMPAGRELRIVHLTDLHMSGRIAKEFFEQMVAAVNAMRPDLVLITGDLVERDACLDWLPDTLGRLQADSGVHYVLGNHDLRVDHRRLVRQLDELGLIHVGGTWREANVGEMPVVIAGNERPWFGQAPEPALMPPRDDGGLPLRILLAHTPDHFAWAGRHDFDLVLAGHNHGGQVRLPLLGAILAPSRSGVRYACGAFRRGNTVMHVSRGTAGLTPFRWNCPPEIALLTLVAP